MPGDATRPGGFDRAHRRGMVHARRHGLQGPDAADCALDLLVHCLTCPAARRRRCGAPMVAPPLHGCADRFAACRARSLSRRRRRELPLAAAAALSQADASPEALALRRAFWRLVEDALGEVGARHRSLVLRRFRDGWSLRELALADGTSEDAVRMAIGRALARVRDALARDGVDAAELGAMLAPP